MCKLEGRYRSAVSWQEAADGCVSVASCHCMHVLGTVIRALPLLARCFPQPARAQLLCAHCSVPVGLPHAPCSASSICPPPAHCCLGLLAGIQACRVGAAGAQASRRRPARCAAMPHLLPNLNALPPLACTP
ncbi:hypothetical protein ABPG75_010280 [Micractinium tetrahymenae]